MARVVTDIWECLWKKCMEKKMARVVTEPTEVLRKTWMENKMARRGYVLESGRRSANHEDC